MTIKFLTPYGQYPANSIVTLDAATEAALVADKVATTNTAGGVAYTPASNGASSPAKQAYADSSLVSGGVSESRYTKGLYFGNPLPQAGSVKDFSQSNNDLVYAGTTTDAEVYNTEAGVLTVLGGVAGAGTAKALCMAISKLQWNLAAGESLFVQARLKAAAISANQPFFGNTANGTRAGFQLQQGAANTVQMRVRCGATGPQDLGSTTDTIAADTLFNVTLWIDGATKLFNGWMNGKSQPNWTNKVFSADGTGYTTVDAATPVGFVLGNAGDTTFPNIRVSFATRFAALRVAVIPNGLTLQNAALLDWKFNRDPMRILTDAEVVTVAG